MLMVYKYRDKCHIGKSHQIMCIIQNSGLLLYYKYTFIRYYKATKYSLPGCQLHPACAVYSNGEAAREQGEVGDGERGLKVFHLQIERGGKV